jgi:hypothetical protein
VCCVAARGASAVTIVDPRTVAAGFLRTPTTMWDFAWPGLIPENLRRFSLFLYFPP